MGLMGAGLKRIPIGLLLSALAIASAACPAMSPVGSPANPAEVASEKSGGSSSPDDPVLIDAGDRGTPSIAEIGGTTPPPPGEGGTPVTIARGGTFNPKGDGESVGSDQQKEATDWRLRFGVNAWWELSRTVPDTY